MMDTSFHERLVADQMKDPEFKAEYKRQLTEPESYAGTWEEILSRPGATTQSTRTTIHADGTISFG